MGVFKVIVELDELVALTQIPHLVVVLVPHLGEVQAHFVQRARDLVGHPYREDAERQAEQAYEYRDADEYFGNLGVNRHIIGEKDEPPECFPSHPNTPQNINGVTLE